MIMALGLAFAAGFLTQDIYERYSSDYPLLEEVVDIFENHALQPLPSQKELEYGMIRGMLTAYDDPYTLFLEPPQHELQTNQLEGVYGGIGVQLERNEKGVLLYPFPEGPAARAGVQNGDVLLSIDGTLITTEMSKDTIEAALRGPVGQSVNLVLSRANVETFVFDIQRQEVAIPSVLYRVVDGFPQVGILQVKIIAGSTVEEIKLAVENLQKAGVVHFILDLRENGGGLLDAGIETARLFLKNGIVIEQQYEGKEVESYSVLEPGPLADIPFVVFVNGNTASSAEIVAGAIQANGRALLIGEPTYGKNTIQQVFELRDGSSLHVTSAHWWFPELAFPAEEGGLIPDYAGGGTEAEWINMAVTLLLQAK